MTARDGGAAFPGKAKGIVGRRCGIPVEGDVDHPGMTLRDWFAGQALAGYFANAHTPHLGAADMQTAKYCYEMADAMLAARTEAPHDH